MLEGRRKYEAETLISYCVSIAAPESVPETWYGKTPIIDYSPFYLKTMPTIKDHYQFRL